MPGGPPSPGVVLVLDDDPIIVELLSVVLSQSGFEALTANSLDEARKVLDERGARVVATVCDLQLGDQDGLSVLRRLRAGNPGMRAIVMSGHPREHFDAVIGPDDADVTYFQKPFRPTDLVRAILE